VAEKKLTGKIARERIRMMQVPRPPTGVVEGYQSLEHASGILSDIIPDLPGNA
jgi:4-hydroxy-4-methyl-2-oxoglutarate aldolase